jgi:hypothetical protein
MFSGHRTRICSFHCLHVRTDMRKSNGIHSEFHSMHASVENTMNSQVTVSGLVTDGVIFMYQAYIHKSYFVTDNN